MRRLATSLSAGLLSLALSGTALAGAPGLVNRSGRFSAPQASLDAAAVAAVRDVAGNAVASLARVKTVELTSGERVVKLDQMHQGVLVARRGAAVTFGRDGIARHVSAWLEEDLPASVVPALSADQAADVARARTHLPADAGRAMLVIWPSPEGNKLAWAVAPEVVGGIPYAPVVVIDAGTGEVILHYNSVVSLNQANVYPTNPVKSPTLMSVTLPVGATDTTLQNALVVSKNCIDQKKVKTINVGIPLTVHVCDLLQTALPDANGDYLVTPAGDTDPEDPFAEVSMFHHVNRAYDYFRGFDSKLDVNKGKPITTVSNLRVPQGFDTFDMNKLKDPNLPLAPFQNAFFAPSDPLFQSVFGITGGAMWFGQGPNKDYAYDGDVVYHEFTHAVVNATLKLVGSAHMDKWGASMAPGAMNEGLADFYSSALAGDPDCGEYAVGDYDDSLSSIRTLDNQDACPKDVGGEVHQDSTLFSGALWEARKALDPAKQAQFDAAIFTAMNSSATGDLGYEDFAKLAHDAVAASPLGATVADALDAAFTAHGVLPECKRILEYTGKPLNGPAALQDLWFAPGTQSTGVAGWTPGVVQVHYKLPANTAKVTIDVEKVDTGGGLGGIFGGGTPFKPKLLVRFGAEPISFTYKPFKAPMDMQAIDPTASGNDFSTTVEVPAGATDVYVMVGSAGQTDGAYKNLSLTALAGMMSSSSSSSSGAMSSSSSSSSSSSTSSGGSTGETSESSGCGCAVPGDDGVSKGALVGAFAALGLVLSRRRRRS